MKAQYNITDIALKEINHLFITDFATYYLNQLEARGLLVKQKIGRENFYLNYELYRLFESAFHLEADKTEAIDSVG